jgi:hypothetical protein
MRGNCDSDVDIDKSGFPINSDLSLINVDGIDIYLTHGDKYSYDYRDKFNGKGVLIYGHYHIPYIRKGDDVIYICVGSISLPRDEMDYSYCIYEDRRFCLYSIDGVELDSVVI